MHLAIVDQRPCNGCTACCTLLPIREGIVGPAPKPSGVPCPHLCASGCGIYAERPEICARFHCAWLANDDWPDEWRPDLSGLFCLHEILPDGTPGSLVLEAHAGALLEPQSKDILLALMRTSAVVIVVGPDGRRRRMHGCWQREEVHEDDRDRDHRLAA